MMSSTVIFMPSTCTFGSINPVCLGIRNLLQLKARCTRISAETLHLLYTYRDECGLFPACCPETERNVLACSRLSTEFALCIHHGCAGNAQTSRVHHKDLSRCTEEPQGWVYLYWLVGARAADACKGAISIVQHHRLEVPGDDRHPTGLLHSGTDTHTLCGDESRPHLPLHT